MNISKTSRLILLFVGLSGCFSVLFGAWLSHAGGELSQVAHSRLSTAQQYQFIHTITLLVIALWYQQYKSKWLQVSAVFMAIGIVAFSGGLTIKTLTDIEVVGKFTPYGGTMLALGWLTMSGFSLYCWCKKSIEQKQTKKVL